MPSSTWIVDDLFYSFILVPDDYTQMFNATKYNVTVFQKDATEDSTLLYFKIFIKENVLDPLDILFLISEDPSFLIGSSGGAVSDIYPVDDVTELQIIEDTIIAGSDLEVDVYTFNLSARVIISGVIKEEVVNVNINVKGKKYIWFWSIQKC